MSKQPQTASEFIELNTEYRMLKHRRFSMFLGHVRLATHGKATDNRNNHPHVGKRGLYLVHYGIISNHLDLIDKYSLTMNSECDSEVLLRLIEQADAVSEGLRVCLREVKGPMVTVVHDTKSSLLWLARNEGRPLWMIRLKRDQRLFVASTGTILFTSLRKVMGSHVEKQIEMLMPVPTHAPVALSSDGMMIAPLSYCQKSWMKPEP